MRRTVRFFTHSLVTTTFAVTLAACGAPAQSNAPEQTNAASSSEDTSASSNEPALKPAPANQAASVPVATFEGAKYIASSPNTEASDGMEVVNELCVVRPPESWNTAQSISWSPSSIGYEKIATDWGTISYRFEYINEAGSEIAGTELSRTTETGYFGEGLATEHTQIGDHNIAYALSNTDEEQIAFGIIDLESKAADDEDSDQSNRYVTLNAWESRGENCAFTTFINCEVNADAADDLSGEQLLADAYAPLEFIAANVADNAKNAEATTDATNAEATTDAAPYYADVTLTSADDAQSVVVHRNGADLTSYGRHNALLMTESGGLTLDFAPEGGLNNMPDATASTSNYRSEHGYTAVDVSDIEEHEVDGRTYHARVLTAFIATGNAEQGNAEQEPMRELRAWCDIDGNALYIKAIMRADEDASASLNRLLSGRIG